MTDLPPILIASPVRDRAWILPDFLARLAELDYPLARRRFLFLANDCTDRSEEILRAWANDRMGDPYLERVEVRVRNLGGPADHRRERKERGIYGRLAALRNEVLDAVEEGEWLFSIDSDILVAAHTLRRLVGHGRDVCAATVSNTPRGVGDRRVVVNASTSLWVEGEYVVSADLVPGLRRVAWTGAVYLLSPQALATGSRYADHPAGEDLPFCEALTRAGIELWQDGDLWAEHCLDRYDLAAARAGWYWEEGYAERLLVRARGRAMEEMISGCSRCCGQQRTRGNRLLCARAAGAPPGERPADPEKCRLPALWEEVDTGRVALEEVNEAAVETAKEGKEP